MTIVRTVIIEVFDWVMMGTAVIWIVGGTSDEAERNNQGWEWGVGLVNKG